ncbi:MAG: ComF family protein [Capsulimonadales bacterium]|nr:ComF family protein [Capsulimonadales bacterium]
MVHRKVEQVKKSKALHRFLHMGGWSLSVLADIVFPPRCLICDRYEADTLCEVCRSGFVPVARPFCERCGHPNGAVCPCGSTFPRFGWHCDAARAVFRYDGPIATAIRRFKYSRVEMLGEPLGRLLAESLEKDSLFTAEQRERFDLIVPIPLHTGRLRERGFNQAERLAGPVADRLRRPLLNRALVRVRATGHQARLSGPERQANMDHDVFRTERPVSVVGKGILLIDDVLTTGATINAAARALKEAGASGVYALTLAIGV